jgi:hypothetical protein
MESEILTSVTSNNYYYKKKKKEKEPQWRGGQKPSTLTLVWRAAFAVVKERSGSLSNTLYMNLPLILSPREKIP